MAVLVRAIALHRDSMLNKYATRAQIAARSVYGVKMANYDWLFNLKPEIFAALAPEDQHEILRAKGYAVDQSIRDQFATRTPPADHSPVGIAEAVLNAPNSSVEHLVASIDDKRYLVHRTPQGAPMQSFHVGVPDNVYDLPEAKNVINKNVHSHALKGLGLGAIGGGALGAGLGALSTSEEGDEATNTALGGTLGALGGGALGSAIGSGR